jgi:hypothetical protein
VKGSFDDVRCATELQARPMLDVDGTQFAKLEAHVALSMPTPQHAGG